MRNQEQGLAYNGSCIDILRRAFGAATAWNLLPASCGIGTLKTVLA